MVRSDRQNDDRLVPRKVNLTYDVQAAAHYNRCGELNKYVNGEISKEQMERMIKISNIPIHLLNPE